MRKESFYFSHDYNSRSDGKIKKLVRTHGMPGYGIFWCIVEDLYNNANALQTDYDGIAYDLRVDAEMVKSIINDFDLFSFENDSFGSTSIERRLDERNEKSEKARQSAFKRWDKEKVDANAMPTQCDSNAIKDIKEKKDNITVFWDLYHQITGLTKTDKEATSKYWSKLKLEEQQKAIDNVKPYFDSLNDKKYCKKARTYLSDKNFNDEFKVNLVKAEFDEKGHPILRDTEGWGERMVEPDMCRRND